MEIRTRFAPSPTGYFHIGGARTALYCWLYAKNKNGKFILRIDDTDTNRFKKDSIDSIIQGMRWLGLDWDEGPFYQSKRSDRYSFVINEMLNSGKAYKCFCSKERLYLLKKKQIYKKKKPRYDGYCRNNVNQFNRKKSYVVRFCNPKKGYVIFEDKIKGLIKFKNSELDDLILFRNDGSPTYNFCVVIDDLDMKITHVIRGEEHLNNTPRQINILKSLNAFIPKYAHVPIILDKNKKKISKRFNSFNLINYCNKGYLSESLLNYLVRLGWSHGDREIFSIDEMIRFFSLKKINKSSGVFDSNKLLWFNHYYINSLPITHIIDDLIFFSDKKNIKIKNDKKLISLVSVFRSHCKTLQDIFDFCLPVYKNFSLKNIQSIKEYLSFNIYYCLKDIYEQFKKIKKWEFYLINKVIKSVTLRHKINMKEIMTPLRVSILGISEFPSLIKIIEIIGKNDSLNRIKSALLYIKNEKL